MKTANKLLLGLISAGVIAGGLPAEGTVQIVTNPTGVYTNPSGSNSGDAPALGIWLRTNVRNNGTVGITTDYARSGNGSAYFSGPNAATPSSSKADFEYFFSDLTGKTLGNLSALSYDWYRDSSSTAASHLHPALRLYFDADGNALTTGDRGYLVYEIGITSVGSLTSRPAPYQSTFYNTQGRQHALSGGAGSVVSADLYIPASWANPLNGSVRTDMWGVLPYPPSVNDPDPREYPIIGFSNYGGASRLRV
ncbi:MAG: hypothetical protein QM813_24820 [Verrucomicrobiota bacterium]